MKKSLFLIPACALAFASCTSNEPLMDGEQNGAEGPGGNQYLNVNIVSAGSSTRAGADDFVDGSDVENEVSKVRFYFFTASGAPASVKYVAPTLPEGEPTYLSYYDWTPENQGTNPSDDPNNVEKILGATIIINTDKSSNDKIPYSVVAVLNPYNLDNSNLSIEDLNDKLDEYNKSELTTKGNFVMSNSIYRNDAGNKVEALPVRDHIYTSQEKALEDPVDIYVERVVAKMSLQITMDPVAGFEDVYDTGVAYDIDDIAEESVPTEGNIYVKLLGWNVTSTPDKSRLMKEINLDWSNDIFGVSGEPWNEPLRFRSYWAINPNPERVTFNYGNFGQGLLPTQNDFTAQQPAANGNGFGANKAFADVYMQENAAKYDDEGGFAEPNNNSKVIIAAQLVGSDGNTPVTLAEWGFNYYTLKGIQTLFAQELSIYKKTGTTEAPIFNKIAPEDITFVTAGSLDNNLYSAEKSGRYYVYPKLVDTEGTVWTTSDDKNAQGVDYTVVDDLVRKMGKVKIWNNGYTYYYFDITHLGAAGNAGFTGVVRNHIYQTNISKIAGLGTPVYDPSEKIYPEKPSNEDSLIAASIKVLTWRIVKKTLQLEW